MRKIISPAILMAIVLLISSLQSFAQVVASGNQPSGDLVYAADGYIYGAYTKTLTDGRRPSTIYRYSPGASSIDPIFRLDDHVLQVHAVDSDGYLYGTAVDYHPNDLNQRSRSKIFRLKNDGTEFRILRTAHIPSWGAHSSLVIINEFLYWIFPGGYSDEQGSVVRINKNDGSDYAIVQHFPTTNERATSLLPQYHDYQLEEIVGFWTATTAGGKFRKGSVVGYDFYGSQNRDSLNFRGYRGGFLDGEGPVAFTHYYFPNEVLAITQRGGDYNEGGITLLSPGSIHMPFFDFEAPYGRPFGKPFMDVSTIKLYGLGGDFDNNTGFIYSINYGYMNEFFPVAFGASSFVNGVTSVVAHDNVIYGTSRSTGSDSENGSLFAINDDGTQGRVIFKFTDGYSRLIEPVDGQTEVAVTPTLRTVNQLDGVTNYRIEISENPDFTGTVNMGTLTVVNTPDGLGKLIAPVLKYSTKYYARVKTNLIDDYGAVTTFTTHAPEKYSFVSSPVDGATNVPVDGIKVTANIVYKAQEYTVEINTSPDFTGTSIVKTSARPYQRTFVVDGLQRSTTYYTRTKTNLPSNWGPTRSFTTVDAIPPPEFTVSAASVYDSLEVNQTSTHTITLSNNGPDDHHYSLNVEGGLYPTYSSVKVESPEYEEFKSVDIKANSEKQRASSAARAGVANTSVAMYATTFEEFEVGNFDGQQGWYVDWGWTVESENPSTGSQHLRGLSDGSEAYSFVISPSVQRGSSAKSTATMKVNVQGTGATWQVIPQSPSSYHVSTRIQFNPDGTASALVPEGERYDENRFEPIGPTPSGYFDLTIEVDRVSFVFDVYFNDDKVFTGQGFSGEVNQVGIIGFMEVAGPTIDIDNIQVIDGPKEEIPEFLSVSPSAGILPSGGSVEIEVTFNSDDLRFGTYKSAIAIDIDGTSIDIPAELRVYGDPNSSPLVIAAIDSVEIGETDTLNVTFTADDPEGSRVFVALQENLAFITPVSSGNGTATYSIIPTYEDAGEYDFAVVAIDSDGETDTATFHLTVNAYGVQDFSLIVTATNQTITTFSDTVVVDVADPAFNTYTIRANTSPSVVGSVRFLVDGQFVNKEIDGPYVLSPSKLGQLSGGYHTILAESYTNATGEGPRGESPTALIKVINSTAVTDFDVVKHPNTKLIDLTEGAVIDISQAAYKKINVRANISGAAKSVVFRLNGNVFRYDNAAPYQLNGVNGSNDLAWPVTPGVYTMTATPYSKFNGQGIAGQPLTLTFQVVNGAAPPPEVIAETNEVKVYPNPFEHNFTIELDNSGEANILLIDLTGRELIKTQVTQQSITLGDQLAPGIYLLRINTNGRTTTKRMVKK